MSDNTPSYVADGAVRPPHQGLSSETIETVLDEFRQWLQQLAQTPPRTPACADDLDDSDEADAPEKVDLHTMIAQFTAVRHEVNLQTKSSRKLMEQNETALQQLTQAVELASKQRDSTNEQIEQAVDAEVRPLVKTLIDLHDSLNLAHREMRRARENVLPALERLHETSRAVAEETNTATPSLWSRLFGHSQTAPVDQNSTGGAVKSQLDEAGERVHTLVGSMLTGYGMSIQRIEKALEKYDVEPIPVVGEAFDPEIMEAVDVVVEADRDTTEVIEELRRGYYWQGDLFRFAQVRVAKPESDGPGDTSYCESE